MALVVASFEVMRSVQFPTATRVVADTCNLCRFKHPRQLIAALRANLTIPFLEAGARCECELNRRRPDGAGAPTDVAVIAWSRGAAVTLWQAR
jgi:hypothetical protein